MNKFPWLLSGILLGAFLLRVDAAFISPDPKALVLTADSRVYDEIAWNMASGKGFSYFKEGKFIRTAQIVGPLYPILLSLTYRWGGHRPEPMRLLQCLLGVVLCWALYQLGRSLFHPTAGILAAGIGAVYPLMVRYSYFGGPAFLLTENLSLPLLALSTLALIQVSRRPSLFSQTIAGLLLGLTVLTRATMLIFPLALLIWLAALRQWPWRKVLFVWIGVTLTMFLTIAPWTWRNFQVFHRFVPISTHGGANFWYSNNPGAKGGSHESPLPEHLSRQRWTTEADFERLAYRAGWEALKADPGRIPGLFLKKAVVFWMPLADTKDWRMNWAFGWVALWAVIGFWVFRREPSRWLPIVVPSLYLTGMAMIFFGDPRYRAPLEPLLIVLASAGLLRFLRITPL